MACSNPLGSGSASQSNFLTGVASFLDNTSSLFGQGNSTGTAWSTTTDSYGNSNYLMLNHSGTPTNNAELDPSWAPAWSNLVGYWTLDGNLGAIAITTGIPDSSSSNPTNTGNLNALGASYAAGKLNQGISFSGSQSLTVPSASAINPCSALTIAFWFKSTALSSYQFIIGKTGYSTANPGWVIQENATQSTFLLRLDTTGGGTQLTIWNSNDNIFDGNWHHIAFTLNSSTVALYKDGLPDTTGTYIPGAGFCNSAIPFAAGGVGASMMDDIAMWNTTLTAAQIQSIYSRQSALHAGFFQSRVMDAFTTKGWSSFAWTSTLPFFKGLPDFANSAIQNENSANYPSLVGDTPATGDNNLMTSLVGLWHLDGTPGAIVSNTTIIDSSGFGANGTMTAANATYVPGEIGQGVLFTGSQYVNIPAATAPNPCSAITVSFWAKNNVIYNGWETFIAKDGYSTTNPGWGVEQLNGSTRIFLRVDTSAASNQSLPWGLSDNFFDGNWHQIAFTLNSGTYVLYKDGYQESTGSYSHGTGFCNSVQPLTLGFTSYTGSLDEVAVWNKVLNPSEINQVYRRGANRIKYQVRSCSDPACGTNPTWLGPDNTNQTYFSELNNNFITNDGGDLSNSDIVLPGAPFLNFSKFTSLTMPANRYFQYRAIMESDDPCTGAACKCNYGGGATWCSPELESVTITP